MVIVGDLGERFGYDVLNRAFRRLLAGAGVRAGSAAMVGDDVESDIGGALGAGLAAILVRTGKYRTEAVEASGLEPTAVVDSIADVPGLFGA